MGIFIHSVQIQVYTNDYICIGRDPPILEQSLSQIQQFVSLYYPSAFTLIKSAAS